MTSATRRRAAYDMHGVGVTVVTDDACAADAMDDRLRGFRGRAADDSQSITFEFVIAGPGWRPPPPAGRPVYDTPHGSLHYLPDLDVLAGELGGVHLHCEAGHGRTLLTAPSFEGRRLYFATHPLATVALMEMMERLGRFSLHAGCLSTDDGSGIILSGPSGAGKSTIALALARAGMDFLADDVVFLVRSAAGARAPIQVLGFPDTIGLGGHVCEQFPELRAHRDGSPPDGFPKQLHRIEDLFGGSPVPRCTPRAIVFPEVVAGQPSAIDRLDPGEALLRLVPDVLLTDAASTQAHLATIGELLSQTACYTLRSGSDLERAAELVRCLV